MENLSNENKSCGKLWGGCFCEGTSSILASLNNSLYIDKRLYNEDIDGSKAYAGALTMSGILNKLEKQQICDCLEKIRKYWMCEQIDFLATDEDVHTVNERLLTEIIGPVGGKLHTGRSRNDQVATDMKLWMKNAIKELQSDLLTLLEQMLEKCYQHVDILMPGYTHLQRAQVVRFSHWLLCHAFYIQSDFVRYDDLLRRVDFMPLGSGAIAGNPFNIDREFLAKELGFQNVTPNSMMAVSDRDFVVEFNFIASLTAIHLSRLAEDLILFGSKEFGFIHLSDGYSTGSSLMPQKRNPDSLELIRGTSGQIFGELTGFMMTLKGLPMTYNKDLQNDKAAMFSTFDQMKKAVGVTKGVIETMSVDAEKCRAALSYDMLATDLAYYLVRKGVPFRTAHHLSGEVVTLSEKMKKQINEISIAEMIKISPHFDESVKNVWNFETSAEQYNVIGGTSKASVLQQISNLKNFISTK